MNVVDFHTDIPRRLRAAMIGCGSHAVRNILPTFAFAPLDLVAVCDLNEQRASAAGRQFGARSVYIDHVEMLAAEQPEVVFVVLNYDENGHPRYPAIASDVMQAGAHVWIEKPPAASSDQVRQMQQVQAQTGRWVGVGFKKMFAPANVKAKEIITRTDFGPLTGLTARYPQSLPPEAMRGDDKAMVGFLDHIVHPYSVLRFLGGPIESIQVEPSRASRGGASITVIHFTNGAVGSLLLAAGQSALSPYERTELLGDGTNVVVENNLRVTHYRRGAQTGPYGKTPSYFAGSDDATAPLFWEPEFSLGQLYNKGLFLLGYAPEILYFCDCLLKGRAPEVGNLDDALELLKIYEAYRQPSGQRILLL